MLKKFLIAIAVLAAVSGTVGPAAFATTVTYTKSVTGLISDVPDQSLVIPQFNPSLGTLNSVTITVSTAVQGYIGVENLKKFTGGTFTIDATMFGGYVVVKTASGFVFGYTVLQGGKYDVTLGAYDGAIDYAGTSGAVAATPSQSNENSITLDPGVGQFFYDMFTGSGDVVFQTDTDEESAVPFTLGVVLPANMAGMSTLTGQASVTVVYDYTHTPEPATMALLALGGLVLRKRK